MSNKTIVCLYTEWATEKVFYDKLLDYIKTKSPNNKFSVNEIKKIDIAGIGKFQNKIVNKFRREIASNAKYEKYKKIVFLCYDEDVFDNFVNPTPPIDRDKLLKDLESCGADEVVPLVAHKSIEDIFLIDIDSILASLGLKMSDYKKLSGSGYQKIKTLCKKARKLYQKGGEAEDFVNNLDIDKICKTKCEIYCELCSVLLGYRGCK